jgi:hypothetical protein
VARGHSRLPHGVQKMRRVVLLRRLVFPDECARRGEIPNTFTVRSKAANSGGTPNRRRVHLDLFEPYLRHADD